MRKSTLFISAMLTVFMLATLFGAVSAYRGMVASAQSEPVAETQPATQAESTAETLSLDQLMSVAPSGVLTPEQAAALAMQIIARTDVFSVESTTYEGASAYLVTFSSGDLVYVSPTGQVLSITKLEPVVIAAAPRNNDGDNSQSGGGEHEAEHQEEHEEEHEDHDD